MTIVILIILSTVTINAVLGENGLIKQAEKVKDIATNSIIKENEDMNRLLEEYENMMGEDGEISKPEEPIVKIVLGEITENSIAITVNATDDSGEIVSYKYYLNGEEKKTDTINTYTFIGLTSGTQYTIKAEAYDKENNKGEATIQVSTTKKENPTDGSYDEEKGVNSPKLGPNMKLVKFDTSTQEWVEGIEYSYVGKEGTGKETVDGTSCKYVSENPTADEYIVHPAFTNDVENGGWDSEIPGIWIGKYETAGSISQLKVVPGVSSLRNQTIGTFYTAAMEYSKQLESHMLKNSEWGAIAYLTHSKHKKGDATYETSGWNSDTATFIVSGSPFFRREGIYSVSDGAGIFFYNGNIRKCN